MRRTLTLTVQNSMSSTSSRVVNGVVPGRSPSTPGHIASRNGCAPLSPRTCLQGVRRCETVLPNQSDWRYLSATLIGYARVSTDDQDTAAQVAALNAGGPVTPPSKNHGIRETGTYDEQHAGLAGLDEEREGRGDFARAGDSVGVSLLLGRCRFSGAHTWPGLTPLGQPPPRDSGGDLDG